MLIMSDILKRAKEKERKAKEEKERKAEQQERSFPESAQQETPPEPVEEVVSPEPEAYEVRLEVEGQTEEKAEISGIRISPIIMKEAKVASGGESLSLYEGTVSLMRGILKENKNYKSINTKRITTQIKKIVNQLSLNDENLLMLAFIKDSEDENYLPYHSVNVCILSIELGLGLGHAKPELIELGISALLHDMGMIEHLHLSNQARRLTAREYSEVKNHPIKGLEILRKIKNLNKIVPYVVHQHHERLDGSGYPRGLKGESISEYARIVGLADAYEAMVHQRSYRSKFLPLEGMREILNRKEAFGHKLIKILIEKIGVFPIGTLAELNTKEKILVVKLDHTIPLRPVVRVQIIREADGKKPKETRMLDLTTPYSIYIKKVMLTKK